MKSLKSSILSLLWPLLCLVLFPGLSSGQLLVINSATLLPGVLYCANDSGPLLCTDDAGITWHDPDDFRGKYRKAWLLAQGRSTRTSIPVTTEVKPAPQKKKPEFPPLRGGPREIVLAVKINGRPAGDFARLLQAEDGRLYASPELIRQWRLQVPQGRTIKWGGQTLYALDSLSGVKWQISGADQTLSLDAPSSAFSQTDLNASYRESVEAVRPNPGLFLNHQLVFTHLDRDSALAGLFEAGFFSKLGVVTSRFADRDFTSSIAPIRLDTRLVRDFPRQMAVLTLGDSISASNPWSRLRLYSERRRRLHFRFCHRPRWKPRVVECRRPHGRHRRWQPPGGHGGQRQQSLPV